MYPSLALNSLCIWGWPSTSGPLASTCGVLGSQVCGTIPSSYTLLEINPKSLCMQDQHSSHEWHLQAQNSPPTLHANCWPSVTIVGTAGNDSHRCHGDVLSSCLTSCPLKAVPSLPLAPSDRPSAVDGMWALLEFCMDGMMWCIIYCVSLLSLPCIHSAGQFCCFSVWGHELVLPLNGIRRCSFPSDSSLMVKFIQTARNLRKPRRRPPRPSIHGLWRQQGLRLVRKLPASSACELEELCFLHMLVFSPSSENHTVTHVTEVPCGLTEVSHTRHLRAASRRSWEINKHDGTIGTALFSVSIEGCARHGGGGIK